MTIIRMFALVSLLAATIAACGGAGGGGSGGGAQVSPVPTVAPAAGTNKPAPPKPSGDPYSDYGY